MGKLYNAVGKIEYTRKQRKTKGVEMRRCERLVVPTTVQKSQDVEEKVDDVKVERDDGKDPFVWTEPASDHVGVVDNVAAENEAAGPSHDEIEGLAEWYEDLHEANPYQEQESREKPTAHT